MKNAALTLILFLTIFYSLSYGQKDTVQRSLTERIVETRHEITIDGEKIAYTASAGTLIQKDKKSKPNSAIFFIAYSPKFLVGESYGTVRACGLTTYLQDKYNIYLNGVMLVSSAINFQSLDYSPGNDLGYILSLPGYTAAALYHNKIDTNIYADFEKTLEEVEDFSLNEYSLALLKGSSVALRLINSRLYVS